MTIDYDQLALEVEDQISTGDAELLFCDTEAFIIEFACRYRAALKEKMEPVHLNDAPFYTPPLYSLEDW